MCFITSLNLKGMKMKNYLSLLAGVVFGIGLMVSGMSNPNKVIEFLDITGTWNPSLAFVMLGAIPISFLGFRWIEFKNKTLFSEELHLPGKTHINSSLWMGSFIFGVGWSITGFCPGPALVALGTGSTKALAFVIAMIIGMILHDRAYPSMIQRMGARKENA